MWRWLGNVSSVVVWEEEKVTYENMFRLDDVFGLKCNLVYPVCLF